VVHFHGSIIAYQTAKGKDPSYDIRIIELKAQNYKYGGFFGLGMWPACVLNISVQVIDHSSGNLAEFVTGSARSPHLRSDLEKYCDKEVVSALLTNALEDAYTKMNSK